MLEGVALVHMLFILVDNFRVTSIDNALDEMSGIIYFRQLLSSNIVFARLDLVFSLELDHLATLADKVEACRHSLCCLALKLLKSLQVHEPNVLDGALDWQVDDIGHFWKNR